MNISALQIENRTSFGIDQIFEPKKKSEGEIKGKPNSERGKGEINKKQTNIFNPNSQAIRQARTHIKTVSLKIISYSINQTQHRAKITYFCNNFKPKLHRKHWFLSQ